MEIVGLFGSSPETRSVAAVGPATFGEVAILIVTASYSPSFKGSDGASATTKFVSAMLIEVTVSESRPKLEITTDWVSPTVPTSLIGNFSPMGSIDMNTPSTGAIFVFAIQVPQLSPLPAYSVFIHTTLESE